jgi:four helix bundle protein
MNWDPTNSLFISFFIAKGSAAELFTQLIIAREIGYITENIADELTNDCNIISVMLRKLIQNRSR